MKKITSIVLALVMMLSVMTVSISGVSADIITPGGDGESVVTLTLTARNLRATVPSVLPIDVDSDNNVTVATNAKITNLSDGPIEVTNVAVDPQNSWTIVPFTTDFTKVPVDTKQYGMTMYDDDVVDGVPAILFDVIEGDSELAVVYDGNVAIQSDAIDHLDIGHVVFTVAWNSGERLGPTDITYGVENQYVTAYMNTPTYDENDYTYTQMTPSQSSDNIARYPAQGTLTAPSSAVKIVVTSQEDGKNYTKEIDGDTVNVDSLIPGVRYNYQMFNSSNEVVQEGKIIPTGQIRMINAGENVGNIRDIGGWSSKYGTVKYNKIFRGARLNGEGTTLSESQQLYFTDFLGIEDEIDLRNSEEVEGITSSAIPNASYVRLHTYAYRVNPYDTIQAETVKTFFTRIANDLRNDKPVYVHCAAGADRTATLIYWLEAILGMSPDSIDRDYELSSYFARERYRCGSDLASWNTFMADDKFYNNGMTAEERAIRYLIYCGVSVNDINTIRNEMLTGTASTVSNYTETSVLDKSSVSLNSRLNSGAAVVAYTPSSNNTLVTDFIPVSKQDVFEFYSDIAQTDTYGGYCQVYDSNYTRLITFSKGDTHIWTWSDDMKHGTFKIWDLNHATSINGKDVAYVRFVIQYDDINNIDITKW